MSFKGLLIRGLGCIFVTNCGALFVTHAGTHMVSSSFMQSCTFLLVAYTIIISSIPKVWDWRGEILEINTRDYRLKRKGAWDVEDAKQIWGEVEKEKRGAVVPPVTIYGQLLKNRKCIHIGTT